MTDIYIFIIKFDCIIFIIIKFVIKLFEIFEVVFSCTKIK